MVVYRLFRHWILHPGNPWLDSLFRVPSWILALTNANEKAQIHSCKQKVKGFVAYDKLFFIEHLEKYTWGLTDSQGWVLLKIKITHVKQ